jgi:penicillin-binding protein 2
MNFDTRRYVIYAFIIVVGFIYIIRLFYMQVIDDSWALRAQQIAEKRKEITPPRGSVYDRKGKKIVSNRTYYNLMMRESDMVAFDTSAFAKLIGWEKEEVIKRFKDIVKGEGRYYNKHTGKTTSNYRKNRSYAFLKEMTLDEIANIAAHLEDFPGFFEEITSMRSYTYPYGANVFGYLSEVNREEVRRDPFYRGGDNIGRAGLEKYYENELRGTKGIKYIVTSAMNNDIKPYMNGKYDTLALQGPDLTLGLDIDLQAYGEILLKGKRGCVVAIEPESGEILALVSSPSFDPNLLVGKRNISENYPKLLRNTDKPLYPRPLASQYPPGSIFKLLQSLVALEEGVITKNSGFVCNKSLVGCHDHPSAQNLADAIKASCNPYFYSVTKKVIQQNKKSSVFEDSEIGLNLWAEYMKSFGLGFRFDTDINGLSPGLIPNSKYYDKWYGHHRWAFSTIRSISIGQGEVQLTPLQMANIGALIANKGWYYTPHFVKSIGEKGSSEEFMLKNITKVDPKHFDVIHEGMWKVVHEAGGTASRAKLKDIVICGKTGTVENKPHKDHSVFLAFAPMDKPKIAISVFVENAGFGGTWAAPIASLMIEKYLKGEISDSNKAREKRILEANLYK